MSDETDRLFKECECTLLSLYQNHESSPEQEQYEKLFEKSIKKDPKETCEMLMRHHIFVIGTLIVSLRDFLNRFSPSEEAANVVLATYKDIMVKADTRLRRDLGEIAGKSYAAMILEQLKSLIR